MADLEDIIAQLQNPGDDGIPDTIYDDLRTAHNSALESTTQTAQAKIDELKAETEQLVTENTRLKSANWDLFEQVGKAGDDEPGDDTVVETEEQTLDDLIVEVEE